MAEFDVHRTHCFRVDEYENEFMGCKYGRDEDCPMKKEYPLDIEALSGANEVMSRYVAYSRERSEPLTFEGLIDYVDIQLKLFKIKQ